MLKCNNIKADFVSYLTCRGILVVAATTVIACSDLEQFDASPNSKTHANVVKIVALGDSTTDAGWEGNAKEVYAARLVSELESLGVEADIVNAGIRNTTSRQAVARLDSDVRHHDPDFVIVQFGINDSWIDAYQGRTEPRLTIDEFAECLTAIIDILRADGAKIILMTPNPMRWSEMYGEEFRDPALGFDFEDPRGINRLLDVYTEQVRYIASVKDVPLIDVSAKFEAYDQVDGQSIHDLLIRGDAIHPNDVGHALIAEWLADLLLVQLQE